MKAILFLGEIQNIWLKKRPKHHLIAFVINGVLGGTYFFIENLENFYLQWSLEHIWSEKERFLAPYVFLIYKGQEGPMHVRGRLKLVSLWMNSNWTIKTLQLLHLDLLLTESSYNVINQNLKIQARTMLWKDSHP